LSEQGEKRPARRGSEIRIGREGRSQSLEVRARVDVGDFFEEPDLASARLGGAPAILEGVGRGPSHTFEEVPGARTAAPTHKREPAVRRRGEDDVRALAQSLERGVEVRPGKRRGVAPRDEDVVPVSASGFSEGMSQTLPESAVALRDE
jgi:hypothetical protein